MITTLASIFEQITSGLHVQLFLLFTLAVWGVWAYKLWLSNGHTPGLMLTELPSDDGPVVYAADLIPGRPWMHLPITMGYDRNPEQLVDEKSELLGRLVEQRGRLFFTHDHEIALGRVAKDAKGRFFVEESWPELVGAPL